MFEWLMDQAVGLVYVIGWVGSINPIYSALLRSAHRRRVSNISTVAAGAAASVGALFWPLFMPFLISNFIHAGRVWDSRADLVDAEEQVANDKLVDASRRAALHQIEASAASLERESAAIEKATFKAQAARIAATADWEQLEKAYRAAAADTPAETVLFDEMKKRDNYKAMTAREEKRWASR